MFFLKKKKNVHDVTLDNASSLLLWRGDISLINGSAEKNPLERTKRFITELQKRTLSEQVLIIEFNPESSSVKTIQSVPSGQRPMLDKKQLVQLSQFVYEKQTICFWEDIWNDAILRNNLAANTIEQLLIAPIPSDNTVFDLLYIVNYLPPQNPGRFTDFIQLSTSVIGLSVENARYFKRLQKKDAQLKEWSRQVERRIDEENKSALEKAYQYQTLFDQAQDGILIHDISGKIIEANKTACRLLGYSQKDLLSESLYHFSTNDSVSDKKKYLKKILVQKTRLPLQTEFLKPDGSHFDAELYSARIRYKSNDVFLSTIRDVTLRRILEQSLQESKLKYRALVESSSVGVFNMRDGIIQFVNNTFADMLGYTKEELLKLNYFDLIHPEDLAKVEDMELNRFVKTDSTILYESRIKKKDNQYIHAEIRTRPYSFDNRTEIIGNVADITALKKQAQDILDNQKMQSISTLAGGIAHDFNNLLGGILGYATLILSEITTSHPYYDDINTIAETTKRAAELTNQILAFARGGKYQHKSFSINKIVNDIVALNENAIEKNIAVECSLDHELWPMTGDINQIRQIIMNLFTNAIEAVKPGGKIAIKTSNIHSNDITINQIYELEKGEYVCISMADNGKGITEDIKSRIFEPFFTTKQGGEGSGLGLAMVYGVVKNHNGSIHLETKPNAGSTFALIFPRETVIKTEQQIKKTGIKKDKYTIMLIDDELIIRDVGKRILNSAGYDVITAETGAEALRILEKKISDIDFILLDWIMPGMGGMETYKNIRNKYNEIPVCFVSGYDMREMSELKNTAHFHFIKKPFQSTQLIKTIKNILE